jgi:hypothetical protein
MKKLIKNWEELSKVPPSKTHYLKITPEDGNGMIMENGGEEIRGKYLSTHTFYDSSYNYSTKLLNKCGFDVQLVSWDEQGL